MSGVFPSGVGLFPVYCSAVHGGVVPSGVGSFLCVLLCRCAVRCGVVSTGVGSVPVCYSAAHGGVVPSAGWCCSLGVALLQYMEGGSLRVGISPCI